MTDTFRHVLIASRPLSWINTAYPFAAAYILTTGRIDALLVVGTLFFLIPYNLLMYGINDVFDYESDLRNPRKGGAEGALLAPRYHRITVIAGIVTATPLVVAMLVLGGTGHPASWVVLAVSLFAVVAYSMPPLRFKERPVLDSITSSTHFVTPALYGLTVAGAEFTLPLVAIVVAFFFWGLASHAFGAVQDVIPDREADIASIATVFGARATVRIAIVLWALAGLGMLATEWPGPLGAILALPYIVVVWPYRSVSDAESGLSNRAWRHFLALNYISGFLVTLLLIVWVLAR
ncbi:prenyltransferase [Agromyces atrinae]|uniref:Prenyltransferase n=1 Tax=Agromyces atrinae TaxID=592376 RepID=A0A4Q2M8P6_9MICO|nr:prenyltransferase [Agromyces atrinae]NYD65913.1 4-hydroxybenzoate polyprenyltransferase [Agromyces atrinae]RXZ86252.1 prenyltransferase [Agromyces atrinae]